MTRHLASDRLRPTRHWRDEPQSAARCWPEDQRGPGPLRSTGSRATAQAREKMLVTLVDNPLIHINMRFSHLVVG